MLSILALEYRYVGGSAALALTLGLAGSAHDPASPTFTDIVVSDGADLLLAVRRRRIAGRLPQPRGLVARHAARTRVVPNVRIRGTARLWSARAAVAPSSAAKASARRSIVNRSGVALDRICGRSIPGFVHGGVLSRPGFDRFPAGTPTVPIATFQAPEECNQTTDVAVTGPPR